VSRAARSAVSCIAGRCSISCHSTAFHAILVRFRFKLSSTASVGDLPVPTAQNVVEECRMRVAFVADIWRKRASQNPNLRVLV